MARGYTGSPPTSSWCAMVTHVTLARRGSGRRLSGGRCGAGGTIGGEIAPPPPTPVFFNTARIEGHKNSDIWNAWRRVDYREDSEESLLAR